MKDILFNQNRRYCRLTNDDVFYAVYGSDTPESNAALLALINTILDRKNDPLIKLTIKNPVYKDGKRKGKGSVLDIRAEASSGEAVDIEMQRYAPPVALLLSLSVLPSQLKLGQKGRMNLRNFTLTGLYCTEVVLSLPR